MKSLLSVLFVFICSSAQADIGNYYMKESTMGYMTRPDAVYFQLTSGGCTHKEDFKVEVENQADIKQVTLYRIRPDDCRAFLPVGVIIPFSYKELGLKSGDHFFIGNSVQVSTVW